MSTRPPEDASDTGSLDDAEDPPAVEELLDDLDGLPTDTPEVQADVRETKALLALAHQRGIVESGVRRLRTRDAAEAFVGSVIFASPLLVEDGVFDIADHLFGVTAYGLPIFLLANTAFVVFMTYALLQWTGRDREETSHLLGAVPTRVVMVLAVSLAVAAVLMTVWGRVEWTAPVEALARVNVLWTVGSIGAALGDVLSEGDGAAAHVPNGAGRGDGSRTDDASGREGATPTEASVDLDAAGELSDGLLVERLDEQFESLLEVVEGPERRAVEGIKTRTSQAAVDRQFGDRIRKYTGRDVAEAFVGGVVFAIPLLVEDGVFDVAGYFLSFRVAGFPVFFLANAVFVIGMVAALVYWAGPQDVQVTRPIFGVVPRRLVGIAVVSFLTAAALMTMWGRVDGWSDPVVAVARISAVWTVASFGAALGDILPGESSGDDINDDLAELGERVRTTE